MHKALAVFVGLAFIVGFGGMAFADGNGLCSYQQQAKQVASEKSDAQKSQAEQTASKSDMKSKADRLALAFDRAETPKPAESNQK